MHIKQMIIAYIIGQVCYWLLKAQAVASSTTNGFPRGWKGVPAYLGHFWVILLVRFISCGMAVLLAAGGGVAYNPDFLPELSKLSPVVSIPLGFFAGLSLDAILEKVQDKIAWLKGAIPPPPPPPESNGH